MNQPPHENAGAEASSPSFCCLGVGCGGAGVHKCVFKFRTVNIEVAEKVAGQESRDNISEAEIASEVVDKICSDEIYGAQVKEKKNEESKEGSL